MRLVKTCDCSPEQYDVYHGKQQVGYLRLRWGRFSARYPNVGGVVVYSHDFPDDMLGQFPDETTRGLHIGQALQALRRKLNEAVR